MDLAPIALFVYKRSRHVRQTIESLQKNEFVGDSELFIFSDGPRSDADREMVQEVREYLKTITGFRHVTVIERERNLGLADSIIAGVTEIVNQHGRVIVLEDDMLTSPFFLRYMNEALEYYRDDERVISIHGYLFPVRAKMPETFFIKGSDCWGWGTWKRGWELFEPDGKKLLAELKRRKLVKRFDFGGSYPYTRMLEEQISGKNDSWAVRWYASALLNDKLTLYPGRSLVHNIGTDESGTHCADTRVYDTAISNKPVRVGGINITENPVALGVFENYYRSIRPSLWRQLLKYLRK